MSTRSEARSRILATMSISMMILGVTGALGVVLGGASNASHPLPGQVANTQTCESPRDPEPISPNASDEATRAAQLLGESFPGATKEDPDLRLREGLIGLASDGAGIEVIVDESIVDLGSLDRLLEDPSASEGSGSLRVVASCRTAKELIAARKLLSEVYADPSPVKHAYGMRLDPASGTWIVTAWESDLPRFVSLAERLDGAITVEVGTPERSSRGSDSEPHRGGAGIQHLSGPPQDYRCSSGFTSYYSQISHRVGITAGHCFNNGANIHSASHFMGEGSGEHNYPTYDMMRIQSTSQDWYAGIWTDPDTPNPAAVRGGINAVYGEQLCDSGMTRRLICSINTINEDSAQLCDQDGCTVALGAGFRNNQCVPTCRGDLGSPMLRRFADNTVGVRGMVIGNTNEDVIVWERVSAIESHLNIEVSDAD